MLKRAATFPKKILLLHFGVSVVEAMQFQASNLKEFTGMVPVLGKHLNCHLKLG